MELPDGPGFDRLCRDIANAPYAELTDDQRAANVLKAFEPLGRLGQTAKDWLLWSDPAFVRRRFATITPGYFCLAKPTVAVMREAADGVEAGRLRVTIDGDDMRVFRHVEVHTDPGDGLGLPLVCTDPAGLDGCRFCSPRSGAKGECESHRRAHLELEDEKRDEANDDAAMRAEAARARREERGE